jgi:UDP-N-acetylglucosamine 1-carboxyvinyltransferase
MDAFRIQGGTRLAGRIAVDGSKNASLPLMAAALMADEPVTLRNVPRLSDISNMARLLGELGCETLGECGTVTLNNSDTSKVHARYDIIRTMRASICVLGPLLARRKEARVSMPGGCAFGARPVDLHLRGLEALGAAIELDGGDIVEVQKLIVRCDMARIGADSLIRSGLAANFMSVLRSNRSSIRRLAHEKETRCSLRVRRVTIDLP